MVFFRRPAERWLLGSLMNKRAFVFFNERVDRLNRSALAKRMATPHYRLDYNRMMNREWISAEGITEDDVDAFVLNVRLLIQDGVEYPLMNWLRIYTPIPRF